MERRLLSRVGGFVHDIDKVATLSDEPNNIRLLSDRSLYILQNLSEQDITFLSRYGTILTGDFYLPVQSGTSEASDVEDAVDLIRRDLNSMAMEDLLDCICQAVSILAEQGEIAGQDVEAPTSDGGVSVGPGEQFPDQATYFEAKCSVSNGIYDTLKGTIDWLVANNADLLLNAFGGITSGLLLAFLISGPVGWSIGVVTTVVVAIAGLLVSESVDFVDLSAAMADTHDEAVLALFNASNGVNARINFIAATAAGTPAISPVEEGLLSLLMTAEMVNQLFNPRSDLAGYVSPDAVDCGTGLLLHWPFDADLDGFSFADESTGGNSAAGVWDANDGDGAVKITLTNVGDNYSAIGSVEKTGLSQAVDVGNSVQFDYSATSDGEDMGKLLEVVYSDASTDSFQAPGSQAAGTIILSVAEAKTLAEVKLTISRKWNQSGVSNIFITDGRVQ